MVVLGSAAGCEASVDGATVKLPAGGYVSDETGEVVEGELDVNLTSHDASNPAVLNAVPSLYIIRDSLSGGNAMISYGIVDVGLFINGEPVDPGLGLTALIDLPVDGHAEALEGRESVLA